MVGFRWSLALVAVAGLSIAGCGGSGSGDSGSDTGGGDAHAGHDHEGHAHADPKNLHEAAEVLAEMRDELAEAFEKADVKAVDEVIHEMGPMVKKAKEMVASSNLDRYAQNDVDAALDQIKEVLAELHPSHGADAKVDPADYDAQKDSLNDALENLKKNTAEPEKEAAN
ncbi:hypothetical protein [Aeoliella sp.]|uniref:hypothetical protein n=1 Tax=Aeoliella sp. TaxID=2795800 RepID=UPI003CCB9482